MRASVLRKLLCTCGSIALLAGVFAFSPKGVSADSVSVIPPRFELFGNPGDTIVEKLRVRNDSDAAVTYSIEVDNFKAKDEEGGVDLFDPNDTQSTTTFQLAKWVTVEPTRFSIQRAKRSTG